MARSAPLKPRGLVGSASAQTLNSHTFGRKDVKESLAFEERGLARSQSAAILARRPNSPLDPSLTNKSSAFDDSGNPFTVAPPVPGDLESDTKALGSFLDSLNLSSADIHALHHVPNTFFYMRMKGTMNAAKSTLKMTAVTEVTEGVPITSLNPRRERIGRVIYLGPVR